MNDQDLILGIQDHFNLNLFELPEFSKIDSTLSTYNYPKDNQDTKYFVERKVRNVPFDAYPDAVVDKAKWDALKTIEEITTVPSILAYAWSCGTWGYVQPSQTNVLSTEDLTPSLDSVSLNAGVQRSVVKIALSDFTIVSRG